MFELDVKEENGFVSSVLWQPGTMGRRVLCYYSTKLEPVEMGHPTCTRALCAIAKALKGTSYVTRGRDVRVHTNHTVASYISSSRFTLGRQRTGKLQDILLQPNVFYIGTESNMAAPTSDHSPHVCEALVRDEMNVFPSVLTEPIPGVIDIFTDGHSHATPTGGIVASYAVICNAVDLNLFSRGTWHTVEAKVIPPPASAQLAEIIAVIRACELHEGKKLNIYTDSAYAVRTVHVDLKHWLRTDFLTTAGKPVKHIDHMLRLKEALTKPECVAVIKCAGHQSGASKIVMGNNAADAAAKAVAVYKRTVKAKAQMVQSPVVARDTGLVEVIDMQKAAAPQEKQAWVEKGAKQDEQTGVWRSHNGRLVASSALLLLLCEEAHHRGHQSSEKMLRLISQKWWHPFIKDVCKYFVNTCSICCHYNPKRTLKVGMGAFPVPSKPWQEVVIDFVDMGKEKRVKGCRYLLVCVDTFTRWVEATPTKTESAREVINWLINDLIPRYGVPLSIRSDNGTHFTSDSLKQVEEYFGIKQKFGSAYHPASQGLVERTNRTIKEQLAKVCADTGMTWLTALPLVMFSIRSSPTDRMGLSPHELLTGRTMPCPFTSSLQQGCEPSLELQQEELTHYVQQLQSAVKFLSHNTQEALTGEPKGETPEQIAPGEWIYRKVFHRTWKDPRWIGPFKVVSSTTYSLKVWLDEAETKVSRSWHKSHCRKGTPSTERNLREIRKHLRDIGENIEE
ncbi:TIP41-like protein isoform X1 [Fundulus heteroclitus]|uniref:TIP41-like protein isoform X1 n=1 Tax=Fundulus heteroclitus TaxID=8078 RepID=UPI00165A2386|nr:TIP41-like protein isoform X1 [Fundulus heteroclitus]